jgi:hypothetical protein
MRAPKQDVPFPLTDLLHLMVFEDLDDAEDFVNYCGLEVGVFWTPFSAY